MHALAKVPQLLAASHNVALTSGFDSIVVVIHCITIPRIRAAAVEVYSIGLERATGRL